jgi:hypothetical protein
VDPKNIFGRQQPEEEIKEDANLPGWNKAKKSSTFK